MNTCKCLSLLGCSSDEKLVYLFLSVTLKKRGLDLWTQDNTELAENLGMKEIEVENAISKLVSVGAARRESGGLYLLSSTNIMRKHGHSINTSE